jgi:outer membrane protein
MSLRRRRVGPFAPIALALALLPAAIPAGLSLGISTAEAAPGETAIAFVDFEHVVSEVDEGQAATDQLKREQAKRQGEISAREADIKRMELSLQKKQGSFSREALEKEAAVYQQALLEYQNMLQKFNKELGERERELFEPVERRVRELLRTLALRDGYDLILSKRAVPYGRKDLDLTEKVIQEYNKAWPSKTKPAAAGSTKAGTTTTAPATSAVKKPAPAPAASGKK